MALTRELIRVGRYQSSPLYAEVVRNVLRGYIGSPVVPKHTWFHTIKFRGGRSTSGSVWVRPIVYRSGSVPGALVQDFDPVTVTNYMADASAGKVYSSSPAGSKKAFMGESGDRYGFVVHARNGDFRINMEQAAELSGYYDTKFYERTGYSSSNAPNPSGMYSIGTQGHMQIWIEGDANESPLAPINVTPNGTVFSVTPEIAADFRDQNGAYGASSGLDRGDYMVQARVEVRRKADSVAFWDHTYSVSTSERDNNRSARDYGDGGSATALVRGTVYQARVRHADRFGDWGPPSSWIDFTPVALGSMVVTSPTGKTNDLTPDVGYTWNHVDSLSADRIRALFYRNNVLIATSSDDTVSVSAGASDTFAWADMGIGSALLPGQSHTVRMQGRDTNSIWSELSPAVAFTTDAAPGTPTNLTPNGGIVLPSSSYPILRCKVVDIDDATLTVKAEILTGAGSLISTRTMTLVAGTVDTYEYQTTGSDLASVGDYKFRCYAGDGYLWSGAVTSEGSATRSAEALFSWEAVPAVTITDPVSSGTITDASPTISWSVSSQDKFRIRAIDSDDTTEIFNSGWIVDSVLRDYTILAGYTKNGQIDDFEVGVEDATLQGFATATNVEIAYTPPESPGNFVVTAGTVGDEPFPTFAELSWTPYEGVDFLEYVIYRSDLLRPLKRISSASNASFQDYHAPSLGAAYTIHTVISVGIDETVISEGATASLPSLGIQGVCLVSIQAPLSERFVCPQWEDIGFTLEGAEEEILPRGATAPVLKRSSALWQEGEFSMLLTPDLGNPEEQKDGLESLARGKGFSFRDRNGTRLFARIPAGSLSVSRSRGRQFEVEAEIKQIMYVEGVV